MRYRSGFALAVVLLAVSLLPGCGFFGPERQHLKVQIALDGETILQTQYTIFAREDITAIWTTLQGKALKAVGAVKAEPDDPQKAVLKGTIRIVILDHDKEIVRAQLDELRLDRGSVSMDHWYLAPNEAERTKHAARR